MLRPMDPLEHMMLCPDYATGQMLMEQQLAGGKSVMFLEEVIIYNTVLQKNYVDPKSKIGRLQNFEFNNRTFLEISEKNIQMYWKTVLRRNYLKKNL